jgi:pimeloyl-ACP methyl ester carboxylesterase
VSDPKQHFIESQRARLAYWAWGNESAPPLLLQHGGRDHSRSWDRIAEAFADDYYVVAPDLRGHGDSDWSVGAEYTTSQNVVDLLALVDHLGTPIPVMAHSFGGQVTFTAAGTFPDKFESIVAIEGRIYGSNEPHPNTPELMRRYVAARRALESRTPRVYRDLEAATKRVSEQNRRLSPEMARHIGVHGAREVEGGFAWKFDNWSRPGVRREEFTLEEAQVFCAQIQCPVLFIVGAESGGKRNMQDSASYFRGGRALLVEGAGHWVHHDQPDLVVSAAREHFARGFSRFPVELTGDATIDTVGPRAWDGRGHEREGGNEEHTMAVDGTYDITLSTPMGERPAKLTLNTDGTALSGKFAGEQGEQAFDGGTAEGSAVKWSATVNGAMGEMKLDFDGNVEGDDIAGNVQFGAFGSGTFKGSKA